MKIKVHVTKADYAKAVKGSASHCALAIAITKVLGIKTYVNYSAIGFPEVAVPHIPLPVEIRKILMDVDKKGIQPEYSMTFRLDNKTVNIFKQVLTKKRLSGIL